MFNDLRYEGHGFFKMCSHSISGHGRLTRCDGTVNRLVTFENILGYAGHLEFEMNPLARQVPQQLNCVAQRFISGGSRDGQMKGHIGLENGVASRYAITHHLNGPPNIGDLFDRGALCCEPSEIYFDNGARLHNIVQFVMINPCESP